MCEICLTVICLSLVALEGWRMYLNKKKTDKGEKIEN
jgi:hypothetical protein